MQTVILPGGSAKNKEWIDTVAANLDVEGIIRPISWDHWLDPSKKFYPKEKADLIANHTKGSKLNIVAKSIGCLVAAYVIEQIPGQINKVILNGIPLADLNEMEKQTIKKSLIMLNPKNLICIQNSQDTHASYSDVEMFLPEGTNLIEKERTDHEYPYFEDYASFLKS